LLHQRDRVVRADDAASQDPCVKPAETPARAGRIAGLHLWIEDSPLNSGTVNIELNTWSAALGEFEKDFAGAIALAHAQLTAIEPQGGEVFAQRAGKQWEALSNELVDAFGCDQEQSLIGTAVNVGVRPMVAADAFESDDGFGDRALGDAAGGAVELENRSGHGASATDERITASG
jgi:hypothetical protein